MNASLTRFTILFLIIGLYIIEMLSILPFGKTNMNNQLTIIKNQEQLLKNDSIIINHYLHQDSLYREHLSECAFISTKQIKIGYNNCVQVIEPYKLEW